MTLQDFSWIKLTGAAVLGTVTCQTGSDTICAAGSLGSRLGVLRRIQFFRRAAEAEQKEATKHRREDTPLPAPSR